MLQFTAQERELPANSNS